MGPVERLEREIKLFQSEIERLTRAKRRGPSGRGYGLVKYCIQCQKLFPTTTSLTTHLKTHSESFVRRRCKICARFVSADKESNWGTHIKNLHKEEDGGYTLLFKIAKKHQRPLRRSPTKENLDQESEEGEKSEEDKFDDTGDENEISLESDSDEENIGKKMNNYVETLLELPDETPDIPDEEFKKKRNDIFGGASCDQDHSSLS